jgi:hypothetical protein
MTPPPRPWTVRIFELIDAGVHDPDEIVERTICHVPPGHAHRTRERALSEYRATRERRGDLLHVRATYTRQIDPHEAYERGARRVIRRTLASLRQQGTLVLVDGELHRRETP